MFADSGAVTRPKEVQKVTQLDQSLSGTLMTGMYSDMRDSPADALRRDLFESRTDERVLIEAFQKEIQEQRDELQQLREHEREQRVEIDRLRRFPESLQEMCSSPERQTILTYSRPAIISKVLW
jgi:hypothetical protein